jgi:uncharacterized protein YndB with AHSA1/START domain
MDDHALHASAAMLIRRPAAEVFDAFVDPAITTQLWFTKSTGRLEPGARVRWDWEMYDVGTDVEVMVVEPHSRLVVEWDGYSGRTTVEWTFTPLADGTFVHVTERGFVGDTVEIAKQAIDSTGGFTIVLAGAKALLEHGIRLNLIADRHPDSATA